MTPADEAAAWSEIWRYGYWMLESGRALGLEDASDAVLEARAREAWGRLGRAWLDGGGDGRWALARFGPPRGEHTA